MSDSVAEHYMAKVEEKQKVIQQQAERIEHLESVLSNGEKQIDEQAEQIAELEHKDCERLARIAEILTENQRLKALCQDAIDEINPHNPMAKKEMDRIIKELAAQPQGGR